MNRRPPREFGDAMLVAAAVLTLALFVALYMMLPTTSIDVQTASEQAVEQAR